MTFQEINAELIKLGEEIETLGADITRKRYDHEVSEATYKRKFAQYCMEVKVRNPEKTQTDVTAEATVLAFDDKLAAIRAESAYRSVVEQIRAKRDRMECLREVSFNLRKEAGVL